MAFTVTFANVVAHTGPSEQEARSWYSMLISAAHAYGRRLELRDEREVIAYISAAPGAQAERLIAHATEQIDRLTEVLAK